MLRTKLSLTLAFAAFFFFAEAPLPVTSDGTSPASASAAPVKIAPFYQCAHQLRGLVYALNEKQIIITGFDYDGRPPAAWFHGQLRGAKGVFTSEPDTFVSLPFPKESCDRLEVGKRYDDENITLTLPRPIKDFQTIGVYCHEYCVNFGHVYIPEDLAVPPAPADLPEHKACPKPDYPGCTLEKSRYSAIHPECPTSGKGRSAEAEDKSASAASIQSLNKMLIGLPLSYLLSSLF